MILEPTHTCFDDALDFLEKLARANSPKLYDARWRIVHALCQAPNGELYAHGWCECGDIAVFGAMVGGAHAYMECDRRSFYRLYRPQEMNRYTIREALLLNYRHFHYGPWEARYREFTGNGSERRVWRPE
jgi:hypothetical protein